MANQLFEELKATYIAALHEKDRGNHLAAKQHYENVVTLFGEVAEMLDELSAEDQGVAIYAAQNAVYKQALYSYVSQDYRTAASVLKEADLPLCKGKVLQGISFSRLATGDMAVPMFVTIVAPYLKLLIEEEEQLLQEGLDEMDESMLAEAYSLLAMLYRTGLPAEIEKNLETSKRVLERGLRTIHVADGRELLEERLSHYKSNFFGKLEYVK